MARLILENASILEGDGSIPYHGYIVIENGRIKHIGKLNPVINGTVIDCTGCYVSPGFIDSHAHDDFSCGNEYSELGKISQGITTTVSGQCGYSLFPSRPETLGLLQKKLLAFGVDWSLDELARYSSYRSYLDAQSPSQCRINYRHFIGHSTLRTAVMGDIDRKPTDTEMAQMKQYCREAMENGAGGMSAGLIYTPGAFATKEEIAELLKTVAEYGGIYAVHMRNESDGVIEAVQESAWIAREAGIPLRISHHKIAGKHNWNKSDETLDIISKKLNEGVDIMLDIYPYNSAATSLSVMFPPNLMGGGITRTVKTLMSPSEREKIKLKILEQDGSWDNFYRNCGGFEGVIIMEAAVNKDIQGKSIAEIAAERKKDEFETLFDIYRENRGEVTAIYRMMSEYDVSNILAFPRTTICTDGISFTKGVPAHPRGFGSFPRVLSKYVKDEKLLTIEEAIYRMTGLPAKTLNLSNKGLLKVGYDADITIFDMEEIHDNATYKDSSALADGIKYVIIGGKIVYSDKKLTNVLAGRFI